MSQPLQITSAQNSKIKLVNRLRAKRGRQREARFVIDYKRDLQRALRLGYDIDFILHCPADSLAQDHFDCEAHAVAPTLFKRLSYRENPDGILAVLHSKPAKALAQLEAAEIDHAIVLVKLGVPGNIGALLRTADVVGMGAVILVDTAVDIYNPNVIRSSTGACFLENVFRLSSDAALGYFKTAAFQIIAADVAGGRTLYDIDFRPKSVIVLGSEDCGLDELWINAADQVARIPMSGAISDSLNVSVSGSLFMYELYRQRQLPNSS